MKEKFRYWTFLVYPESAPNNWVEILEVTGVPFSVSPLHEFDVDEVGELKKAHYHVILCFSGPTTYNNVKKITDSLNSPIPLRILSVLGRYEYHTHQNNPEKYQYNVEDIRNYNGFKISNYSSLLDNEDNEIRKSIIHIINRENITTFRILIDYLISNNLNDLLKKVSSNAYFYIQYLQH